MPAQFLSRNAANTLAIMGLLSITMFAGITVLALTMHARAQASGNPSVISQIAAGVFGGHAILFYLYQAATAGILATSSFWPMKLPRLPSSESVIDSQIPNKKG